MVNPGSIDDDDACSPLWRYVTKGEKVGQGGTVYFICNFCGQQKQGTYTRIRAHLLQISGKGIAPCKMVSAVDKIEMEKVEQEAEKRAQNFQSKHFPLPPSGSTPSQHPSFGNQHTSSSSSIETSNNPFLNKKRMADDSYPITKAFNIHLRSQLDSLIARMFYVAGLPFNLARNPCFREAFMFAANNKISSYVPPSYDRIRTSLLLEERKHVETLLKPIKMTWKEKGVSIVSDGWSDIQKKPLINFIAICDSGPMFVKAVDASGDVKDKHYIANLLKEVIEEVGAENVVQVITDNASNCKGAGEIIERLYPHIYWTPCVVYTLNLALKNICHARNVENTHDTYEECHWITKVHGDASQIKLFITNHSMRLAIYNKFNGLKLLSVADTRFASIVIMLKRLKLVKSGLQTMVVSDEWMTYKRDDVDKAAFVEQLILDDSWWAKVDYILEFTRPIYHMIRQCDTDKPCLHLCYEMWDAMIEEVKRAIYNHEKKSLEEHSSFFQVVYDILVARWSKDNTPLHCMAYSLNPRYYGNAWLSENSVRVPPHRDGDISLERNKCFVRFFPNPVARAKAKAEFANFSLMDGSFRDLESISDRDALDPKDWWANHGSSAPLLQSIALKLLGQVSSSSCSERNWSTYGFIHSLSRKKLLPKYAEDLLFIHNNFRLLARNHPDYLSEASKYWDINGDGFETFEDMELQFAALSLDEPEMERVFFVENTSAPQVEDEAEDIV